MKNFLQFNFLKRRLLLFVFLLSTNAIFAQFTLSGKVSDSNSKAIDGANVVLVELNKGAATSADGSFSFENLQAGKYSLKVSYIGMSDYSTTVNLSSNKEINIELNPSAYMTDEVVVTGTRAGSKTPIAYTNLTKKDINERNLGQDIPILLELIPAYVSTTDGGGGVGYTNMRIRGSDNSRINVTMNGIPMNDAESHGVWWVNMPDLASSLEDVQVQRGVGTSTNGAGAFGASINLRTNKLNKDPYGEVNIGAGSFGTQKYNLKGGSGLIADMFTVDARVSYIHTDGYIDRARADLFSAFLTASYYGENNSLVFNFIDGREETYQAWNGVPKVYLDDPELRTFNQYTYENEVDNYHQTHYQMIFNQKLNENWNFEIAGFYVKGRGYYEQYKGGQDLASYGLDLKDGDGVSLASSDLVRQKWLDNDFYGFVYNSSYNSELSNIVYGGGYNVYDGDHFGKVLWVKDAVPQDIKPTHEYYRNNAVKTDVNMYARIDQQVGDFISLYGDIQYRMIDYKFIGLDDTGNALPSSDSHKFFLPKGGVSIFLNDNSSVFASYARGAREPNRSDYTENISTEIPRAEYLNDFEFGYRLSGSDFAFEANGYYMLYQDQLIATGKLNDVGEYIRVNVPESYRVGIELVAGWKINKQFRWDANFSYSNSIIKEYTEYVDDWDTGVQHEDVYSNTKMAFAPDVIAASNFQYSPLKGLTFGLISKYVGDQYIDNTENDLRKLNAYFINNIKAEYTLETDVFEEVTFSALFNNLFNVKYENNAWVYKYKSGDGSYDGSYGDIYSTPSDRPGYYDMAGYYPQAGFNFLLGVRVKI